MFVRLFSVILAALFLAHPAAAAQSATQVTVSTSKGDFVIALWPKRAPKTVANFLRYVRDGHYDGTIFHRVIKDFMIQGGGFTLKGGLTEKPTRAAIRNEADKGGRNRAGTIAMARTPDPHSATAQFFINTTDNTHLDHRAKTLRGWGYTAFGRVVRGMDVVRAIAAVRTGNAGPMENMPAEPVVIRSIRIGGK
jgi:cyclophilin family peptidyl-prolyl cis-trans isomerase